MNIKGQKWYVDNNGKRRRIGSWGRISNPHVRKWARNKENDILAGVEKNIDNEGHIYIFSLGYENLYKIGKTKNVMQRLKSLCASNPNLRIVLSAWVKNMHRVEKELHKKYKKFHVEREIFQLSSRQIVEINRVLDNIKEAY